MSSYRTKVRGYLVLLTEVLRIFYNLGVKYFRCLSIFMVMLFAKTGLANTYNFEDLQALEVQKAYKEFLDHARDIRPSQRSKIWSEMLSHMATDYMVHLKSKKDFDRQTFQYVQFISDWPELREDAFFHTKREVYLLDYVKDCYSKQHKTCRAQAKESWDIGRKNLDNGTLLAEVLSIYDPKADISPYISLALKDDVAKFYCRKDFIQGWVLNSIAPKIISVEDSAEVSQIVTEIVNPYCIETMKPLFERGILSSNQELKNISYRILKAFKFISYSDEDLYLTTYLLDSPSVGKTFNLAWSMLRQISQDFERRKSLLSRLAKLDPLPDALFDSGNILKRDTVANFLFQHIPEYISFYAETCVNYRLGKGDFPKGNPTLYCDKFFEIAKNKNWLSQEVTIKYSALQRP